MMDVPKEFQVRAQKIPPRATLKHLPEWISLFAYRASTTFAINFFSKQEKLLFGIKAQSYALIN